jgi:hypothetical protein
MIKNENISKKIRVEFDSAHIPVLIAALETFSRLQSGQVSIAFDQVYHKQSLTWDEREYLEKAVRTFAFPRNLDVSYDGHGGFYDQYNNEYDEKGNVIKESEEWKRYKKRPHLDHTNSYFGVGCAEMREGTIAWEIKKALEEYLHYERNDGYRDMGVDGDGVLSMSGIPAAQIINPLQLSAFKYWKPEKAFRIPQKAQSKVKRYVDKKDYPKAWETAKKAIEKEEALPQGSSMRIEEIAGTYYVVVSKPIKKTLW